MFIRVTIYWLTPSPSELHSGKLGGMSTVLPLCQDWVITDAQELPLGILYKSLIH
jgi:hypothetical protein